MLINQITNIPTVSLPFGSSQLPLEVIPWFDRFKTLILWMSNDQISLLSLNKFAVKLGIKRVHIV